MTTQFTLRVAVLGAVALVAFAAIFFRLWYLEVLSSDDYVKAANDNRLREVTVRAPRGEIRDRSGRALVDNRTALALQLRTDALPELAGRRRRVLERLAEVTGIPTKQIRREIRRQSREFGGAPITLRRDVPYELVYYLRENQDRFPGISVEEVFVREYPHGTLGAHLFGYVGEVNSKELETPAYQQRNPGDLIGKLGLEREYDHLLRGRDGAIRVPVDAFERQKGRRLSTRQPQAGDNLVLELDLKVQKAGEAALGSTGLPGAFVALSVEDGAVLGLGSSPSFDPSIFTAPVRERAIEAATSDALEQPIFNRAVQGAYPVGSTFKAVTSVAALEDGILSSPTELVLDTGSIVVGEQTFQNAGDPPPAFGSIDIRKALQVSSDVFFYRLGQRSDSMSGEPIQRWAQRLGMGSPTGVDLLGETSGLIPTPEWRNQLYEDAADPDSAGGTDRRYDLGETDRPWSVGDSIQLAIGQGDVQVSPLQLAVAYAAIGNGGEVVRPHLVERVEDPTGRIEQEIVPEPRNSVEIGDENRAAILDGLRAAAMEPGGTSFGTFGGYPIAVAGKTGTAERPGQADQSWYALLAPADDPEVAIVVTVERGGFGAETAAPIARTILNSYFNVKAGDIDSAGATDPVE